MDIEAHVLEIVERRADQIISFGQRLIQTPSVVAVPGDEARGQRVVTERLREIDCCLDVWEPDIEELRHHPEFQDVEQDYRGRPMVVGVLPGAGGGRSLILNGHVDVVAPGPEEDWPNGGPWSGAVVEGRLHGRGASDMKAGLASYIEALACLREAGVRLKGDVLVQSVIDEEQGGNGTLAAVLRGYRADGALIGEPTNMTLVTKNAGICWVRIVVPGKSAHGAYKDSGVNAIDKAILLYRALLDYEAEQANRISDPLFAHYDTPFPFSLGVFQAGDWPSVVPDRAVMAGRIGFSPEETREQLKKDFEARVMEIAAADPWLRDHQPVVEWFGLSVSPAQIADDHPLVAVTQQSMEEVLGRPVARRGKAGGTDMRLLVGAGIPTLQVGPGHSAEAHSVGESVAVRDVIDVTKTVALTLMRWCGVHP